MHHYPSLSRWLRCFWNISVRVIDCLFLWLQFSVIRTISFHLSDSITDSHLLNCSDDKLPNSISNFLRRIMTASTCQKTSTQLIHLLVSLPLSLTVFCFTFLPPDPPNYEENSVFFQVAWPDTISSFVSSLLFAAQVTSFSDLPAEERSPLATLLIWKQILLIYVLLVDLHKKWLDKFIKPQTCYNHLIPNLKFTSRRQIDSLFHATIYSITRWNITRQFTFIKVTFIFKT